MTELIGTVKPLSHFLMKLKKMDMQDIAEMFGDTLPDYWSKERMVRRLEELYTLNSREFIALFSYPVITFVTELFEKEPLGVFKSAGNTSPQFGDMEQIYDQLEYMGLIDYEEGQAIVSRFLYDTILNVRPDPQQLEEWQEMELCALGILDIYGLMEESHFLDVFCRCYPKLNPNQAYDFLSHRIEVRILSYVMDMGNGYWWFSDLVEDPEEWYAVMQQRAGIPYHPYSREDFIDFAMYAFREPPRHYNELFELLVSYGMDEMEAEEVLAADIIAHRSQLDMRIEIPKFIRDIVSRQSIQEARKVFDLYTGFANSIPTWYNKGSAPAELHAPDSSKPADSAPRKNNVIPFPTVRKKKVSRNDLCPCGSGKKYKDCCGKSQQDE